MATKLVEVFEELERQRLALLTRLEGLDDAHLNAEPQPGKWSIIQILCHLTLAERLSLENIRKKMANPRGLEKSGMMSALKSWALKMFLRSRLKFKAPARSTDLPDRQGFEATKSRWDDVRRELNDIVNTFPVDLDSSLIFNHPVMGPMNMRQTLSFFAEHFGHHARQIEGRLDEGRE